MARAFAPGHVSGAFAVHTEAAELAKKGSRGMGWSTKLGATATVTLRQGSASRIRINGQEATAEVTRQALGTLSPGAMDVDIHLDLPTGQGFGMSAAGTLAACLAATHELGLEAEDALAAAHAAEVGNATGLGDAVGSWFGSGEVRLRPGCPPDGWAMRIEAPADASFLYCVLGEGIATPSVIRDAAWIAKTQKLGDAAVDRLLAVGRGGAWKALLQESHQFSLDLGLMPQAMRQLGERLPPGLTWGQCMLGNTLWVTGPSDALHAARPMLASAGHVIACGVDANGARMLRDVAR